MLEIYSSNLNNFLYQCFMYYIHMFYFKPRALIKIFRDRQFFALMADC